jgi:membrane-associated phospholipid phosphatase
MIPLVLALGVANEARAEVLLAPVNAPPAENRDRSARLWLSDWPTFSAWEGAATVAAGATTGVLLIIGPPKDANWEGGVLFDNRVRDGIRLDSAKDRQTARTAGDYTYYAAPLLPLIIDPLVAAWAVHGDRKAALNLEMIGIEAFAYSGMVSFVSTRFSRRERPDSTQCRRDDPDGNCPVDTESFWSGHTSISATSAGLVCANHARMPLWGHPVADAGACVLATSSAVATGVTRLAADRHYSTDVLAGFGLGFGIGYAVPTLLHYTRSKASTVSVSVAPGSPCTGACLKIAGTF